MKNNLQQKWTIIYNKNEKDIQQNGKRIYNKIEK